MSEALPGIRSLALQVLERETQGRESAEALSDQLEQVFGRLHEVSANVIGDMGYLALMARTLRLARKQFPWLPIGLTELTVRFPRADWGPHVAQVGTETAMRCASTLLPGVLELIASFIGEDFTIRLVRRAWGEETVGPGNGQAGET
jgi:hypothetical protein